MVGGEDAREGLGSSRGHAASEQCWETSMTNEWVGSPVFLFLADASRCWWLRLPLFVSVQLLWQLCVPKGN